MAFSLLNVCASQATSTTTEHPFFCMQGSADGLKLYKTTQTAKLSIFKIKASNLSGFFL